MNKVYGIVTKWAPIGEPMEAVIFRPINGGKKVSITEWYIDIPDPVEEDRGAVEYVKIEEKYTLTRYTARKRWEYLIRKEFGMPVDGIAEFITSIWRGMHGKA